MSTLKAQIGSEVAQVLCQAAADQGLTINDVHNRRTRKVLSDGLGLGRVTPEQWSDAEKGLLWLTRQLTGVSTSCKSCGAPVQWVFSARNRARMPIDPLPRADGTLRLEHAGRTLLAHVLRKNSKHDGPTYRSHFSTCPHAGNHRAARSPAVASIAPRCTGCDWPLHADLVLAGIGNHLTCGPGWTDADDVVLDRIRLARHAHPASAGLPKGSN